MKHYELLFVLKPTLTDEEAQNKVALIKEVLEKNDGEIASIVEMGTRKLAYEVKKFERGIYFVFYFKAPATSINEIERIIRINEDIIKFMTVKFENKKEISHWEKLVKPAKEEVKPQEKEEEKQEQ
ncbi:MAG: 30S ribosomal protein S6 [Proteobacteria bacterium]|nr:MAG: 30S ribosomal protein S6 [Pseudomonadota bacterium]